MKPFWLLLPLLVLGDVSVEERINDVYRLFAREGPSPSVLQEYEALGLQLNHHDVAKDTLAQFYFKKALIEINLHKDKHAIDTLAKVLELDPLLTPAHTKLVELLLEQGDYQALANLGTNVSEYENKYTQLMKLAEKPSGNIDNGLGLVDDLVLVSPLNASLYETRIAFTKEALKKEASPDHFRRLIKDLERLIKLQPVTNLDAYTELAQYLLYTRTTFKPSWQYIKNCLRIDNDHAGCGAVSKHYSRFQKVLEPLEEYSILQGHVYATTDDDIVEDYDWPTLYKVLFEDGLKITAREKKSLPWTGVNTNFEYLEYVAQKFSKEQFGSVVDLQFLQDLRKLACEAQVQTKQDKASAFCAKHVGEDFFPRQVPEIDALLKAKKYNEAAAKLNSFSLNVKKTALFVSRAQVIENIQRKQQQQQQRQFHQQQQQRQHYQQQQRQATADPKVDYYKVLDVPRDADERTIKKAHRTQTLKYHPDKYKGNDLTPEQIEAKMQEINQAYEVLLNPELRERFDRGDDPNDPLGGQRRQQGGGHSGFDNSFMRQFMGGQGGFQFGSSGSSFHFGSSGSNFNFGGPRQRVKVQRGRRRKN